MKVSICMITYNHEKFISQAIESVLMQKTNFDFELVIGEDCSIDRTREIVIQYQKNYPNIIRLILHKSNVGMNQNFIQTISSCRGEYIALLEGDDFWTSQEKLLKQVKFLDTYPECSICFHKVIVFREESENNFEYFIPDKTINQISTIKELLVENFIPTLSVMYRGSSIPKIPDELFKFWFLDWQFHIMVADHGFIGYIDEVMGKYRRHDDSACSKVEIIQFYLGVIDMFDYANSYLMYKYDTIIRLTLSRLYFQLSSEYLKANDIDLSKKYLKKYLTNKNAKCQIPLKLLIYRLFLLYFYPLQRRKLKKWISFYK